MAKESIIQHYSSSTTGSVPMAGNLTGGELAINIADEKIFYKNLHGEVLSLSETKDLSGSFAHINEVVNTVNGITGGVSITSGSNITITQSGKTITIAGGVTWSVVTADQTLTNNTGSFANKSTGTLALTLPTTAAVGTTIRVSGMQNAWRLAQNASQKINFGRFSTTTGTGGYIESTDAQDSVELVCCVANTEWNVVSSIGNMTIV